jgi:crotonobetaine/carnitine-CoA ligase
MTGRRATYGETWTTVRRWITWLQRAGVRRGDRVVSMLPASIDAVALWLATGCLGALEVPVDPALRGTFLRHVLTDSGARVGVVRPEHADTVTGQVDGLQILTVDRIRSPAEDHEPAEHVSRPSPGDAACVIYTSGTTGLPKGVVISWAQMSASIGRIPRSWLSERDCVYDCHPMFHVTGRTPLLAMSDVGGRVFLRERFSASAFLDDVRAGGCTSTTVQTALLLATPEEVDDAENPLRVVFSGGGHGITQDARFAKRFGTRVLQSYGSTEIGFPLVLRAPPPDLDHRWVGRARPGYEVRLVDPAGEDVPDGEVGGLWVRPPARELMLLGYLNQPELTAAATADGWYRTGDALTRSPDGTFAYVDRMRDTIRRNGENISSSAVEAVVVADPAVAECAVLGVPDAVTGQAVALVVVPAPGGCRPEELYDRLTAALPRHALPSYVLPVDSLPRTPTQKVRKAELSRSLDPHPRVAAPRRPSGPARTRVSSADVEQDPREIVARYWEGLWQRRDLDVVDELMGEPYIRHSSAGTRVLTRAELKRELRKAWQLLHGATTTIDDQVTGGDKVWTRATSQGLDLSTGATSVVTWLVVHRLAAGRLVESWSATLPGVDWRR